MAVLPDPAASRAILVGAAKYATLEGLPAVENNLTGLQAVLTDPVIWGLPAGNCTVLRQPGSAQTVLDTLQQVAASATDTLLVYFAGHGLIDPGNDDELYLALPGSDRERAYRTAVPYSWVRREIQAAHVRRKVVILDCCYSGRALGRWMGDGQADLADRLEIDGTCVLTATARTRRALAPPGERFTAFTGELIAIIAGGIPDGPELLDMDILYGHLTTRLRAKSLPLPQRGQLDRGGDIALARNQAPTAPAPPAAGGLSNNPAPSGQGQGGRRVPRARHTLVLTGAAVLAALAASLALWLIPGNGDAGVPPALAVPAGGLVSSVAFSPVGGILAAGDANGTIREWQAGTRTAACSMTDPRSKGVNSVAFNIAGTMLAAADGNGHVYLWACGGKPVNTLNDPSGSSVKSVAFSSDGNYLAIGDARGNVYVWKLSNYSHVFSSKTDPHSGGVNSVAFNYSTITDGYDTLLAAGDANGNIDLWIHQTVPTQLPDPSGASIQSVTFTPDNQFLVAGDTKGKVYEWSYKSTGTYVQKGRIVATLTDQHGTDIRSVAVSPATSVIAAADTNGYIILGTKSVTQVLSAPASGGIRSVAFSPDGRNLAAGGASGYVYLWNLPS